MEISLSLSLSPSLSLSLQNPDVWHFANIIQDLLDWDQNECRKRGNSFSESTAGNKPIKKPRKLSTSLIYVTAFSWLSASFSQPPNTHTHTPISVLSCFQLLFSKSSILQNPLFISLSFRFLFRREILNKHLNAPGSGIVKLFYLIVSVVALFIS